MSKINIESWKSISQKLAWACEFQTRFHNSHNRPENKYPGVYSRALNRISVVPKPRAKN